MPNYAKLQAYLPGDSWQNSKPIPKAGTIIRAETPPLKTKNWKYNLHTMNKFARKNRYLASSTYGDKPSVPNAPSASINGSSLRRIAPAQTHSSHPWVDWRRSWKTEKGKQNSISPCDNIQQNALCLSTWSWQMAHSGPPTRSRSLSREGSWHWWLKNFTMTHSGLIANFCEKNPKNASPKGGRAVRCFCYPREGKEFRMTMIVTEHFTFRLIRLADWVRPCSILIVFYLKNRKAVWTCWHAINDWTR